MSDYSPRELATAVLQFLALDAERQLRYALGVPCESGATEFPFGLAHSPVIALANATYNLARVLVDEECEPQRPVESLQELEALVQLILCAHGVDYGTAVSLRTAPEWRLVRKLSSECLRELGLAEHPPAIPFEELSPQIMD